MEDSFVFSQAKYPCFLLDEELNIVRANDAAQNLPYTPAMFRLLMGDTELAALRCGQPVQLPWNRMPDMVCTLNVLPVPEGFVAVVQAVASRPDNYRRMLEKTAGALHGLLVTMPTLQHFMEDGSQGVQALEYSLREGYRALRSVCDQHWCARLAAGGPFEQQKVELAELLSTLCEAICTALPEARIECTVPEQPVYVCADRSLLEQIICHAVNNALLYGNDLRRVQLHLQVRGGKAVVHICDEGTGIQAQTAPYVFEAYYSCDPYCDTEERPGDGLGLYLIQQGLRAMGGECVLESEFGRGTQLSFTLPLTEGEQPCVHTKLAEYLLDRFSCVYLHFCPLGAQVWL